MQFTTSKNQKPLELPTSAGPVMQRQRETAFPKKARACTACATPPQPPTAWAQRWPGFLTPLPRLLSHIQSEITTNTTAFNAWVFHNHYQCLYCGLLP